MQPFQTWSSSATPGVSWFVPMVLSRRTPGRLKPKTGKKTFPPFRSSFARRRRANPIYHRGIRRLKNRYSPGPSYVFFLRFGFT